MKRLLLALLLVPVAAFPQCANNNSFEADISPSVIGETVTEGCVQGGDYFTVSVIAGETYIFSTCGGNWDTYLTLYNSTGGAALDWNNDFCGLQSEITWVATFTGTLWVLLDEGDCTNRNGCGVDISATWVDPDAIVYNDDCIDATPIACGDTMVGNTDDATNDSVSACGTTIGAEGVWFVFTGTGDYITASLCNSAYDTKINVYEGDCNTLNCVTGNDDACASQSSASFASEAGLSYFILVQGWGGSTGDYELELTCETYAATLHQDCGGALTICTDDTFGGNAEDNGDYQDLNNTNSDCLTIEHQSQWFVFSPLTTGTIEFTLTPANGIDYDFAIWGPYDPDDIQCPPSETPIRCSYSALYAPTGLAIGSGDDTEPPSGDAWVEAITVTSTDIEQYYLMLIDNYTADNTAYTFEWNLTGVILDCSFAFLPVELSSFTGSVLVDRNELRWRTESELNNSHFEVQRSTDLISWENIGEILGQGTTNEPMEYLFNDRDRPFGTAYYRLQQFDFNGENEYSEVISLTHTSNGDLLALYPNPGKGLFRMDVRLRHEGLLIVQVLDLSGRTIEVLEAEFVSGSHSLDLDLQHIPDGSYIVDLSLEGISLARNRVVKRSN